MSITRREFVRLLAGGAAALGILKIISLIPPWNHPDIVRPPGAVEEEPFNQLCVRCGICLEVCPTKAIVLANFEDGVKVANTPKIDPLTGPCEFYRGRCQDVMRCSKFCPTGALQLTAKEEVKMGTVEFSREKCLAYMRKECIVCDEMCPVPGAINITPDRKPVFDGDKCVGCGICVFYCPATPKALALLPKGARRVKWLR